MTIGGKQLVERLDLRCRAGIARDFALGAAKLVNDLCFRIPRPRFSLGLPPKFREPSSAATKVSDTTSSAQVSLRSCMRAIASSVGVGPQASSQARLLPQCLLGFRSRRSATKCPNVHLPPPADRRRTGRPVRQPAVKRRCCGPRRGTGRGPCASSRPRTRSRTCRRPRRTSIVHLPTLRSAFADHLQHELHVEPAACPNEILRTILH